MIGIPQKTTLSYQNNGVIHDFIQNNSSFFSMSERFLEALIVDSRPYC